MADVWLTKCGNIKAATHPPAICGSVSITNAPPNHKSWSRLEGQRRISRPRYEARPTRSWMASVELTDAQVESEYESPLAHYVETVLRMNSDLRLMRFLQGM
jgi:hypothetical protein